MNLTFLTLMTMFVMVYTASLCKTKRQLLDDILQSASSLEKQVTESGRNQKVKMISDDGPTCVKGFFCLAEKALEDANISSANNVPDAKRLINQLFLLNKKSGNTNCTLTTTNKYHLGHLLKAIIECTEQCKEQLIQCV